MSNLYRNSVRQPVDDWKTGLELIKAQIAEFTAYKAIMTAYERSAAEREIQNTINTWKPKIIENLLVEQDQAINRYRVAERGIAKANTAEANRWDSVRLGNELQVARLLVEQAMTGPAQGDAFRGSTPSKQERMKQLYQDAQASGDMFKQRAVAEVLLGLDIGNDMELNHLQKQAGHDLKAIRRTEDQQKAEEALEASWTDVVDHTIPLEEAAPLLGESTGFLSAGPFSQALKRVSVDQAGNRHVYDADAEEIQSIVWKTKADNIMVEG